MLTANSLDYVDGRIKTLVIQVLTNLSMAYICQWKYLYMSTEKNQIKPSEWKLYIGRQSEHRS